jgi:hypothetical protein
MEDFESTYIGKLWNILLKTIKDHSMNIFQKNLESLLMMYYR